MATNDTHLVRIILHNDELLYLAFQEVLVTAWWDEDDNTWNDVEKTEAELKALTTAVDPNAHGMSDLHNVEFDSIDWNEIVVDELEELNIQAGRSRSAGLNY